MVKRGTHACAGCGCNVPQKVGVPGRVRKWCPDCDPGGRYTKADTVACKSCGVTVQQEAGSGRRLKYCSDKCRRAEDNRASGSHDCVCGTCGKQFRGYKNKRFCSERCRWPFRRGDRGECQHCGAEFAKKKKSQRFCCFECNTADAAKTPRGPAAEVYTCMNCAEPFQRKRYSSGSISCGTKYCSRDCAFKARRLKKKCAERPLEIANKLATWFLSWGADCWPAIKKCRDCGLVRRWAKDAPRPPDCCQKCARQRQGRRCSSCGVTMPWSATRRVCDNCRDANLRESRRKSKSKYGRNHRQRTRSRGAPYTPIRNSSIYERDNWECQICCRPLEKVWKRVRRGDRPSPRARTVDHVIPLARGKDSPGHVWHNLIACCHECNSAKCDKDPTGWACPLPRSSDSFAIP